MLKKDITYNDLDDNPITETFWFHLSKAEMAEMALAKEGKAGGFDAYIKRLVASQDGEVLIATFKEILLMTIGERSEDNKRFIKSDEITRNFVQSDAYSVLLMELLTDAEKMSAFINGVVPSDMRGKLGDISSEVEGIAKGEPNPATPALQGPQARVEEKRAPVLEADKDNRPDWLKEGRVPSEAELKGASQEELMAAFRLRSQAAGPVTQEQIPPQ